MYLHQSIKLNKYRTCGFSLIELMVSLSVFAIVMVVSTTAVLSYIDANAKAQALYSTTTNLSFVLDSMTREIRTGYRYYCLETFVANDANLPGPNETRDCLEDSPGKYISFVREKDDKRVGYRLYNEGLEQNMTIGGNSTGWVRLTSEDVKIDTFEVVAIGTETYVDNNTNLIQPYVLLKIKGHVNNGLEENTDFNIQTNVTQRRLDIY